MGSRRMSWASMAGALLLAVALMGPGAAAQQYPACAQRLIPCAQYLSTTTMPPQACCGQIKEAVDKELPCLCSLLNNKGLLQAVNINITQALELPKRCGISSDTSICSSTSTNTTTGATGPSAPPATPGKDGNAAAVARTGAAGLVVLLAFWWSVVA